LKDSNAHMNFGSPRQNNHYINQHINDLEINEANLSTSTFKACGPDGNHWNSSKLWLLDKDDSEEFSDNKSNISSGFKCLKALINSIWNGNL